MATAAANRSRGTAACSRDQAETGSTGASPASSTRDNHARAAAASVTDACSSAGSVRSRSFTAARAAGAISLVAIRTVNRSSASSTAVACSSRTVASTVAVRRASGNRRSMTALELIPWRANTSSRPGGTSDKSSAPAPTPTTSAARFSARTISGPDALVGVRRNRSSSDERALSGTVSSPSRRCPSSRSTFAATAVWSRSADWERTSATRRTSTLTPGSSTRSARSHVIAWSNSSVGRSERVHARATRNSRSRPSPLAKSQ